MHLWYDGDMTTRYGHVTRYGGITFRSKLEATWAQQFDRWGLEWEYEPERVRLPGVFYQPDFLIMNSMRLAFPFPDDLVVAPCLVVEIKPDIELPQTEYQKVLQYVTSLAKGLVDGEWYAFLVIQGSPGMQNSTLFAMTTEETYLFTATLLVDIIRINQLGKVVRNGKG